MKEKILTRTKETVKTETVNGEAKTETKTENEEIVDQETICQNVSNLAAAISNIYEIDCAPLMNELEEIKTNIITSLLYFTRHLKESNETT